MMIVKCAISACGELSARSGAAVARVLCAAPGGSHSVPAYPFSSFRIHDSQEALRCPRMFTLWPSSPYENWLALNVVLNNKFSSFVSPRRRTHRCGASVWLSPLLTAHARCESESNMHITRVRLRSLVCVARVMGPVRVREARRQAIRC